MSTAATAEQLGNAIDVIESVLHPRKFLNEAVTARAYQLVLGKVPAIVLEEAAELVIHGEAGPGFSLEWAPTATMLLDLCKRRLTFWNVQAAQLRLLLDLPEAVKVSER